MKPKKGLFKAILRGIVKSIPLGNTVVEVVENFKAKPTIENENVQTELKEQPHNWVSITIQLLIVSAIIYSFITKEITVEKLIELFSGISI